MKYLKSTPSKLLVVMILFFIFFSFNTFSESKQLPSPIYGGDYYYQAGCINHVKYGGNPLENCNLLSDNPGYLPLYSIFVAGISKITNIDVLLAQRISSAILIALSLIILYFSFKKLFKDPYLALIGGLLFFSGFRAVFKYTEFTTYLIVPLFIFALITFYYKQNYKNSFILAVSIGIATLSHSTMFPVSFFITGLFFLFIFIKKLKEKKLKNTFFIYAFIVFSIGFIISLLYWYEPLFIYHGKTSLHYLEWNGPGDLSKFPLQMKIFKSIFNGFFFNDGFFFNPENYSIKGAIFSILSLYGILSILSLSGIFFMFFLKKKTKGISFSHILFFGFFIIALSYFITIPLLGIHFVPNYINSVFGKMVHLIFALASLSIITKLGIFKQEKNKNILFVVLAILLIFGHIASINKYHENQWYKASLNPLDELKLDLQKYLVENTDVNDVVLTTKEVGFMLNALSGRKLLVSRRAQNDAFEDMDVREMDAAVILYGDDLEEKKRLIEKNKVKYLYWDYYWIQSEYTFDESGNLVSWFDPLIAFDSLFYRNYLDKNNVSYIIQKTWVDPSLKGEYRPQFDLIFITPKNYRNQEKPWNENLDPYLKEVWSKEMNGKKLAVLYKIDI